MECEVSCKYSKALVTFSKTQGSILIIVTFSGVLILDSSIVAPFLSPDGHTCSSRRFCTLITWMDGVTWDKIEISCFPSLIALRGRSILTLAFYSCMRFVV
jgi:hypothetical protein